MNKIGIYPSIMCVKPWDFKDYLEKFEKVGITSVHFDVMDGHFVPNVMLGSMEFDAIHQVSNLPIDVHLMCIQPEDCFNIFKFKEGDMCCFHPETSLQPYMGLLKLKQKGVKAGFAISPAVSLDYVSNCLDALDYIMFMSINPGFAGQTMLPGALKKLKELSEIVKKADHKIEIIVDGNTTVANAVKMVEAGATGLVTGTSSMLKGGPELFEENYNNYVKIINK